MNKKTSSFSKLSIKKKVQYIFIFAMGICVLLCFILFYSFMRVKMTESIYEKNNDRLNSIEQNFESVISNVNNISKLIMVNDIVIDYLKSDKEAVINANLARSTIYDMINSFSGNYSVFIFKNDKRYIHTGIGIIRPDNYIIFQSDWFDYVSSLKGKYTIIPNTKKAFIFNTQTNIVSFTRIINDIDTQTPLGMLVINIPVNELEYTYDNFAGKDSKFAYVDKDKNIICSNMNEDDFNFIYADNNTDNVQSYSSEIINKYVVMQRQITDTGISVVYKSRVHIIEEITIEIAISILSVMLIAILIMFIINAYINKYVIYPISKLAYSMNQAETGELVRVNIDSNDDEIGRLKDCYNEMLVQIDRLIGEVVEQEKQRQKAEMNVIQEQIKPHFLYNTLDTIGYMSLQNSREEVYDVIETLGNFYRKFLSKGSENITLSEEISIVKDYIKLQRLRYNDMFEDEYDIQENLNSVMILKLLLQPLVENSIYHGIRPKGEKGIIKISVFSRGNIMHIIVFDSGIGMNQFQIAQLLDGKNKTSFGFKGTIDRIKNFYQVDDVVKIRSVEGEYCEIEITIPLQK